MPKGVYERVKIQVRKKQPNPYRVEGDVVYMELTRKDKPAIITRFSLCHLERVIGYPYRWGATFDKKMNGYYVAAQPRRQGGKRFGKSISLHRFVTNAPPGTHVDHDDHDTLNNLDANLIVTTPSANNLNRLGANRNSKSGIRGVAFHKASGKWQAQFRNTWLGVYADPQQAGAAVQKAMEEYRASIL